MRKKLLKVLAITHAERIRSLEKRIDNLENALRNVCKMASRHTPIDAETVIQNCKKD